MASSGISVFDSRELQAALLAFKILPKEINALTRKYTKKLVDEEWQRGLERRAVTPLQRKVLVRTAVSSVTNSQVTLKAAGKGRTSRGTPSDVLKGGAEFGAHIDLYSKYQRRSRKGGNHTVVRRTMRGFGYFRPKGRVVFPTAHDLTPRVASIYIQTLLRTTAEVFEN